MNNQEQTIFFALLRNALFGSPLNSEDWKDDWSWKPIIEIVEAHVLQTLVVSPMLSLPKEIQPSAEILSTYQQLLGLNIVEHARLNADVVNIFQTISKNGYNPVLMKGQGNATFYQSPYFRKCGDVDVYVGPKDFQNVCRLLETERGFKAGHADVKHMDFCYGEKTEVEIHQFAEIATLPQKNNNYRRLIEDYFRHPEFVEISGRNIPIPPLQFNVLYVFYHMLHHLKMRGVGYRQLCDVACLLHSQYGKYDLDRMKQDIDDLNMMREWQLFGDVFVKYLGLPVEEFPFYKEHPQKKVKRLVQLILEDGNFAKTSGFEYKNKSKIMFKLHSFYVHNLRYYKLARISLPLSLYSYLYIFTRGVKAVFIPEKK